MGCDASSECDEPTSSSPPTNTLMPTGEGSKELGDGGVGDDPTLIVGCA